MSSLGFTLVVTRSVYFVFLLLELFKVAIFGVAIASTIKFDNMLLWKGDRFAIVEGTILANKNVVSFKYYILNVN